MTTVSDSVNYKVTRDVLCTAAIRLCGGLDPENTAGPSAIQLANAAQALNLLIKHWQTIGLELWERKYAAVFPQKGQQVYVFGDPAPAGDHACISNPLGTGYIKTTLAVAMTAGSTSANLTTISTTGTVGVPTISILDTWFIGIQQDDGNVFWTTVNGSPVVTTVPLASGITSGASAGQVVYSYQTKLMRPLRLLDGFFRQNAGNDIPSLIIPRENYNRFGQKSSPGTVIQLYYDPQSTSGLLYVYPTSSLTNGVLFLEIEKPIDDVDSATDDFNFPQEWLLPLQFGLALIIAPEYEVPESKFKQLQFLASTSFDAAKSYDQEWASLYLQPSNWVYTDKRGY